MAVLPRNVMVDTGYWYALFEARDAHYRQAQAKVHHLERATVVFPWPTLYETLRTRFVKNSRNMAGIERILKRSNVQIIDDAAYRDLALEMTFDGSRAGRCISLCDVLIRLLIDDVDLQIGVLLTFNEKDFVDVCRNRGIEMPCSD